MVKKTTKTKSQSVSRAVKTKVKSAPKVSYNYNEEFHLLDSLLTRTKRIKFQQWVYSLMLIMLFVPLLFKGDSSQAYLTMAIVCLFGLFFSVYIAQSNRILVLLTQIKYTLEKDK